MSAASKGMRIIASDLNGLFAVVKPTGITSAGVINKLKQILLEAQSLGQPVAGDPDRTLSGRRPKVRIGHGGTLDMNASGVLVIGVGQGTKCLSPMLKGSKRYQAVACLGTSTDTQDALGKVVQQLPSGHVTRDMIVSSLRQFLGDTMQVPPLYSALKVNGVRMSDLVMRGEDVQPKQARLVTVHSLKCVKFTPPYFTLDIHCGGGFYVRQLVHDLGKDLGTCAHLAELTRTQQGPFTLASHALPEDKWTAWHIREAVHEFNQTVGQRGPLRPPNTWADVVS